MAAPLSPSGRLLVTDHDEPRPTLSTLDTHTHVRGSSASSSNAVSSRDVLSSPTTSISSKTAAFFGTSGSVMRPASQSVSSSSSFTSPADDKDKREGSGAEADESAVLAELHRDGNGRGSQRSDRRWDTFEGRPVTPLPSPGIWEEDGRSRKTANIFDTSFVQRNGGSSSSRNSSQDRQGHLAGYDVSISDSFSSIPSLPSLGAIEMGVNSSFEGQGLPPSSSPCSKTSSFFGASRPSMPARTSTGGQAYEEESTDGIVGSLPAGEKRLPSTSSRLYGPSRLPSAPMEKGVVVGVSTTSSASSTPTFGFSKEISNLPSAVEAGPGQLLSGREKIAVPTATISPPSPHPEDQHNDQLASHSSSTLLSSFPSSLSTHRSQSRHVHGPSENATGSSLLPSVQALHEAHRGRPGSVEKGQDAATAEESEDESAGRIGCYQIKRTLGVGAFSRVVLASEIRSTPRSRSEGADGMVALKMLEREPCMQNERMRVSWVREVEVLKVSGTARLQAPPCSNRLFPQHIVHPSIVRFLTSFSTPKHHNLVLERVAGGELFDLLSTHQAALANREWLVRTLFGELANAVGWMHSINLVHRDIKLENIILTHDLFSIDNLRPSTLPRRPLLKISDFGLSRFVDPSSPLLETRCGSEEYAAPELIIGKRYDGRKTDVWAMGVVLYALLSGALPFLSNSEGDQAVQGTFAMGTYARERGMAEQGALARKAHLLRIAKGDLRWPASTNEASLDQVLPPCPTSNRLITPLARRLVARLLRRDANKRANAWEAWDEEWLTSGSIRVESSAGPDTIIAPLDPRCEAGQAWLTSHTRVQSGASELTHDD